MSIRIGSKWKCIDPDLEEFGLVATVKEVNDEPGTNGDGEIELEHENGEVTSMKVRRFHFRYRQITK